jgi:hypothetical protein
MNMNAKCDTVKIKLEAQIHLDLKLYRKGRASLLCDLSKVELEMAWQKIYKKRNFQLLF